jgi:hypothetical protein
LSSSFNHGFRPSRPSKHILSPEIRGDKSKVPPTLADSCVSEDRGAFNIEGIGCTLINIIIIIKRVAEMEGVDKKLWWEGEDGRHAG